MEKDVYKLFCDQLADPLITSIPEKKGTAETSIRSNSAPWNCGQSIQLEPACENSVNNCDRPDYWSNAKLLNTLLQANVGESVLKRFPTLSELGTASLSQLASVDGIGPAKAKAIIAAYDLSTRMRKERAQRQTLDSPALVADLLLHETVRSKQENAYVALLDSRNRLIRLEHIGMGTLDSVLIHPREVYAPAIEARSASIILAHTHPSGDSTPSQSDIAITRELASTGQMLRIPLLDHIIVGKIGSENRNGYSSLRELGYLV